MRKPQDRETHVSQHAAFPWTTLLLLHPVQTFELERQEPHSDLLGLFSFDRLNEGYSRFQFAPNIDQLGMDTL